MKLVCNTFSAIVAVLVVTAPLEGRAAVALLSRCNDGSGDQRVGALARELAARGVMLRSVETTPRPCAKRVVSTLTRRFNQARASFEAMQIDEAANAFADLRRAIDEAAGVELGQLPQQTLTYLGWIGLQRREMRAANEAFEAAARHDPSWRPEAAMFPPNVIAAYDEQRVRFGKQSSQGRPLRIAPEFPRTPGDRLRQALDQGGAVLVSELAVQDLDGAVLVENDDEASALATLVGTPTGVKQGPSLEQTRPSAAVPDLLALLGQRPQPVASVQHESILRPRNLAIAGGALAVVAVAVVAVLAVRSSGSDTVHVEVQPPIR